MSLQPPQPIRASKTYLVSVLLHCFAVEMLLALGHPLKVINPTLRPGIILGLRNLSYYAPGSKSPNHAANKTTNPEKETVSTSPSPRKSAQAVLPQPARSLSTSGVGQTPESGRGDGDIKIAMQVIFPYPKVAVPAGVYGNVVVNVTVDEHGTITEATLVQGLTPEIDSAVLATVRQWIYTPATRNGIPVASEQEAHFHFEH